MIKSPLLTSHRDRYSISNSDNLGLTVFNFVATLEGSPRKSSRVRELSQTIDFQKLVTFTPVGETNSALMKDTSRLDQAQLHPRPFLFATVSCV